MDETDALSAQDASQRQQSLYSGLSYKRLERGRYPSAETLAGGGQSMAELGAYLEGINLGTTRRLAPVHATRIA